MTKYLLCNQTLCKILRYSLCPRIFSVCRAGKHKQMIKGSLKFEEQLCHKYEVFLMSNLSCVIKEKGQFIKRGTASTQQMCEYNVMLKIYRLRDLKDSTVMKRLDRNQSQVRNTKRSIWSFPCRPMVFLRFLVSRDTEDRVRTPASHTSLFWSDKLTLGKILQL